MAAQDNQEKYAAYAQYVNDSLDDDAPQTHEEEIEELQSTPSITLRRVINNLATRIAKAKQDGKQFGYMEAYLAVLENMDPEEYAKERIQELYGFLQVERTARNTKKRALDSQYAIILQRIQDLSKELSKKTDDCEEMRNTLKTLEKKAQEINKKREAVLRMIQLKCAEFPDLPQK